jgi:hypothetical protein
MFDTAGLSEEEFNQINLRGEENKNRWRDVSPTPFIAVIDAETGSEACSAAAKRYGYDGRCLCAEKITMA